MKHYVLGYLFDEDSKRWIGILKNRPEEQRGKINGLGGRVEAGETPEQAMEREFREETGYPSATMGWHHYLTLNYDDKRIDVLYTVEEAAINFVNNPFYYGPESEQPMVIEMSNLPDNLMENVQWHVSMAQFMIRNYTKRPKAPVQIYY